MKYFLFLDESGDHGIVNIDPNFTVFVLAGILISENNYEILKAQLNTLKKKFWGDKKVILHSRDIRKCEKEFVLLFNIEVKKAFYENINQIISNNDYLIISSAIQKQKYVQRYGKLLDDVYEISLSFIIERAIFYLDEVNEPKKELEIIIEKRGKKEDSKLNEHFNKILQRGTGYVNANRIKAYDLKAIFKQKKEDVNGLQLADLVAYPIARYVLDPQRANPAFEVLSKKIYSKNNKLYGLKVFP